MTFPTYFPIGQRTSTTSLSSSLPITVPIGANGLLVQALSQNVHFRFDRAPDGSSTNLPPATTDDMVIIANQAPVFINVAPGETVRFIQAAATPRLIIQPVRQYQATGP